MMLRGKCARWVALAGMFAGLAIVAGLPKPTDAASPLANLSPSQRPHLKTVYSSQHTAEEFVADGRRGVAFVFLGTECPVARQYLPRLKELHTEYNAQGIAFVGVYSDVGMTVFRMATHAHDEDLPFLVVQDVDQKLANSLEVQVTPEVVLLDAELNRVYQGAIDNQFQRHGRRVAAVENHLADALAALVAGKRPERDYVPASGCPIERNAPQRQPREVTFHRDIAPLVQKHCQECHREGGPGPFELVSYDDLAYNTEKIREVVLDRRMPPWHGVLHPDFGKLLNNKQLPREAQETLLAWIDAGAPEGNPADAPPPVRWPAAHEWAIGQPDFVYRMPQPFPVPQSGILEYQFFRVPLNFQQDRWFRAVEIKPGNPEVVHHITLHVAPAMKEQRFDGLATMAQLYGITGEQAFLINDFVPGDTYNAKVYPPEQAVRIPKHSDLIFEVHYTPNNRAPTTDQSMVAFQWADGPPQDEVLTTVFRKPIGRFRIPPHHPHYRVEDNYHFKHDVLIDAIRPHFHLRGKSFRVEIVERDPQTDEITRRKTVLTVPIFDQAWQRTYELAEPIFLPAGTEIVATGHFDNSRFNPNNPDPAAEVAWGQQTTDEMFSTRFKYRLAKASGE
jgi:thiol-disulfide isomerase/thioredoxin